MTDTVSFVVVQDVIAMYTRIDRTYTFYNAAIHSMHYDP